MEELIQEIEDLVPLVNEELKSQLSVKSAECDYEGCGSEDSWPTII